MAIGAYSWVLRAAVPVGLLALGWRLLTRPEYRPALGERFGRVAPSPQGKQVIWLHAVSVGETISAVPLARALRETYPEAHIVLSCGTPTGRATAREKLEGVVDRVIYLAYDLPGLVNPAVGAIRPDILLLVETEIWPNLLAAMGRRKVPVLLVNGRISRRSFPRYLRFKKLMRTALAPVSALLMQTGRDARYIRRLGAPSDRVAVLGNIKYDQPAPPLDPEQMAADLAALGIDPGRPVLVAGSTHEGEEEGLARAWRALRTRFPDLALVIAIRHPNRAEGAARRLTELGFSVGRKSLGDTAGREVAMLDTVGELARHYHLATVAFVGGSLVPVGGHNPLEPAAAGKPVVYGPHVSNFEGPCAALEEAGGAIRVADEGELAEVLERLFADADLRHHMGTVGQETFLSNKGAVQRTMARVREFL